MEFAQATDPTTFYLSQGVLGVTVLVLGLVCKQLFSKIEKQQQRIEDLQELRLQDNKEMMKDVTEVMRDSIQSDRILAEKIEVSKQQGRQS